MKANREDVVCTLLAARCLISDPEDWTQRANSRNLDGRPVGPLNDGAVCWCAEGALYACAPIGLNQAWRFLVSAARDDGYLHPNQINDSAGHAATLAMYDRAIELAAA